MADILSELQTDHVNITRLLDLLERQLAVFDRGDTPDYEFIADLLAYCRGYPDRYHHPREDAIVDAMRRRSPESEDDLALLRDEHEHIAALTERFAEATQQVLQDQEMPRDWFDHTAREFIDLYRRHVRWEDEKLFNRARELLTAEDWRAIEERFAGPADPVFASADKARFQALRRALLALEDEA